MGTGILMSPGVYLTEVDYSTYAAWDGAVMFVPYTKPEDGECLLDANLSYVFRYKIIGIEREDGKVDVYKNSEKLKRPLRNKEIFQNKYFTEAI